MQVIKVEDLEEDQLKYNRVIKFTILCDDDKIDWVTYHVEKDSNSSYYLREVNSTEDISSIKNFCIEFGELLRIGKPIDKILLMDDENILNFSTDPAILKRARQ